MPYPELVEGYAVTPLIKLDVYCRPMFFTIFQPLTKRIMLCVFHRKQVLQEALSFLPLVLLLSERSTDRHRYSLYAGSYFIPENIRLYISDNGTGHLACHDPSFSAYDGKVE